MSVSATLKFTRISAQKARLVVNQIRGLPVQQALDTLRFSPKKASDLILKVLNSAIANAEHNDGLDVDDLKISSAFVNQGPKFKRFRARAKGRGARILKPTCHITVAVSDSEEK